MERTTTWSKIGTDVSKCKTINEVLEDAGLNYKVSKVPVFAQIENGDRIEIPRRSATVRSTDEHVFGVVGNNYKVCQNEEAFDFINCITDNMEFVKAGETANGLIYVIAQFPETTVLGDTIRPHIIFQNGHNGTISLKAAMCMLRMVCQNQFNYSFRHSANTISIRHSGDMGVKLAAARETVAKMHEYVSMYKELAGNLSTCKVDNNMLQNIIKEFIGDEDSEDDRILERKDSFLRAYNDDDNQNFKGTAWGVVNAYTDYLTHIPCGRRTSTFDERHFVKTSVENNDIEKIVSRFVV